MANEYRVTSVGAEALSNGLPGEARVTSVGVEVLANIPPPPNDLYSYAAEVLHDGQPDIQVYAVGVEVLRSIAESTGRRRQLIMG